MVLAEPSKDRLRRFTPAALPGVDALGNTGLCLHGLDALQNRLIGLGILDHDLRLAIERP